VSKDVDVQQTLDATVFSPLVVKTIKVKLGGTFEIPLDILKSKFDDQAMEPFVQFNMLVCGEIGGGGIKWKRDKDGFKMSTGSLEVNIIDLISVLKLDIPIEATEPMFPLTEVRTTVIVPAGETNGTSVSDALANGTVMEAHLEPATTAELDEAMDNNVVQLVIPPRTDPECFATWEDGHEDCLVCKDAARCQEATEA
jgi:hypothetical protein